MQTDLVIYIFAEHTRQLVPYPGNGFIKFAIYISTEPIDAVNTNCATETSPKKDVQEALILTTSDAVHVIYWFLYNAWHLFISQMKAW